MQIFARYFTQLLSNKIYTLSQSFVELYLKNDKIILFQPRQPPFLSVLSIVFTDSMSTALKRVISLVIR